MPPTFKVVVAMCILGDALSIESPEGTLICEGAMLAGKIDLCSVFSQVGGRRESEVGAGYFYTESQYIGR